jgi:hypothetical protein
VDYDGNSGDILAQLPDFPDNVSPHLDGWAVIRIVRPINDHHFKYDFIDRLTLGFAPLSRFSRYW